MGIPRFFKFINEKYSDIVYHTSFNQGFGPELVPAPSSDRGSERSVNTEIDNLYLDANGIIHLFKSPQKDGKPGKPRLAKRKTPIKPPPTGKDWEKIMFQNITKYIDLLFKYVKPKKLFYIAIDGSAPIAKQQQQRQRRFKSYAEAEKNENKPPFDGTNITPGTRFMKDLNEYLDYFIKLKLHTDPEWKKVQVIFSDSNVVGEGEQKCINYIRSLPNKNTLRHCMYGLDADLFMLALSGKCPNFYLLREDVYTVSPSDSYFYKVDIGALIVNLNSEYGDSNNIIDDFIFICFMVGNDFLHALQAFHDLGWSIDFIMNMRKEILGKELIVNKDYTVNFNNLLKLLEAIKPFEADFIAEQFYANSYENITLNSSLINPAFPSHGIDLDKYSTLYYKKAGIQTDKPESSSDLYTMCEKYISSLEWINYYYHHTPLNWRWSYQYHYSPLIKDLVKYLSTNNIKHVYNIKTEPLKPIEQLVCVLPSAGFYLLPKSLQNLCIEFEEYYPKKFDIDLEGKHADYEGVALLPFINLDKILPRIDDLCKNKGIVSKNKLYKYDYTTKNNYKSQFGNINGCNVSVKELK